MNNEYLAKAREKVPDAKTLIVLASQESTSACNRRSADGQMQG